MRRTLGVWLVAAVLTACTASDPAPAGPTASSTPTDPAPTGSTPASPDAPEAPSEAEDVVSFVVVDSADLGGAQVRLIAGGDTVEGQVTLDECGYDFTSEADRVARRQVRVSVEADEGLYSQEVVAYVSEDAARHAMREWHTAVRRCPDDQFVRPDSGDLPALRTEILELHPMSSLPVRNNAVVRQHVTTRNGRSAYLAAIYQQHGIVLSGSYLTTAEPPSPRQVARLTALARTAGARMVTLPGGDEA